MPIAGLPRNPDGIRRFERWHRNRLILAGRDQDRILRETVQEPGTIRRVYMPLVGYIGAGPPFSWSANDFDGSPRVIRSAVSASLRYLVSTLNVLTAGNQRSMPIKRQPIPPRVSHTAPSLVMAGNAGYRPTVRSRVPSYGSRIPALNVAAEPGGIPGAEG